MAVFGEHVSLSGFHKNGQKLGDMLFSIDELIEYISTYFTLKTGDIIFTGTPVGVGPVAIDDHLTGFIEERKVLEFNCK